MEYARAASPSSSSGWTSARRRLSWRASPAGTPGCCLASYGGQDFLPVATVREWRYIRRPTVPSLAKFMERYGLTVGSALVLARRLLGCSERPRRWVCPVGNGVQRLHRTREEAREARMDVLGCDLGAAETGACSAGLGKRRRRPNPVRCHGRRLAGWLERGPVRCSRVRVPGGAVLNCWGGGEAETASMADGSL